jgi:hypothetical protein
MSDDDLCKAMELSMRPIFLESAVIASGFWRHEVRKPGAVPSLRQHSWQCIAKLQLLEHGVHYIFGKSTS